MAKMDKTENSMNSAKYRPDIDGLRTLAVLMVILYHVGVQGISGGFVGVDVFFVISGYLITGIIYPKLQAGTFSYQDFYLRRIKRIYPTLLLVVAVTFIASYFFMMQTDFKEFINSALASLLSLSNFFFMLNTGGYFDQSTDNLPLLHTWSLSVEEQFYILWPIILTLAFRFKKGAFIFIASLLLSIGYSQYLTLTNPSFAYYMIPSRAFELLIGGMCSIYLKNTFPTIKIRSLLASLGAIIIIASSLILSKHSNFPGLNALPVCLGTAMIIIAGNGNIYPSVNKILSFKPVVYIGKISYAAYLWHWPLIAFYNYRGLPLTPLNQLTIIITTLLLSSITFHFIENKTRYLNFSFQKTVLIFFVLPVIAFTGITIASYKTDGFAYRFKGYIDELSAKNDPSKIRSDCHTNYYKNNWDIKKIIPECNIGDTSRPVDGYLWGDSFGNASAGFFDSYGKANGLNFQERTISWTPPIPATSFGRPNFKNEYKTSTASFTSWIFNESLKYKYVVLSADWRQYDKCSRDEITGIPHECALFDSNGNNITRDYRNRVESMIKEYINHGVNVIIFNSVNGIDFNKIKSGKISGKDISTKEYMKKEVIGDDEFIHYLVKKYSQITYIDPNNILCKNGSCTGQINGKIIYRDGGHLNWSGSKELGRLFVKE
ncbi:acyltransferase family protein [Citrobacter werkmanii]|uniref:acyltransferase family protein n=1 Tax=Citrobacter werkmanii TaxID=67827 RepID=UPI0037C90706